MNNDDTNKPPDPSVFRAHQNSDCQCLSVVEFPNERKFALLTADSAGRVKLWNGETLRNVWTAEDAKLVSILAVEVVEDDEDMDACAFITHGRDGSAGLWVSSSSSSSSLDDDDGEAGDECKFEEEKRENIFPPKRWRRKPTLKQVLETESECHTFCRMSNVIAIRNRAVIAARPASERGAVELVSVDLEAGRMTSKPLPLEKSNEDENNANEKYGSVSALRFLSKQTLMIGYESGHVTVARMKSEGDVVLDEAFSTSSNSNLLLQSMSTQRCFKDMVTCIDSYVLEDDEKENEESKKQREDEHEQEKDRPHVVAIGCADGSSAIYRVFESDGKEGDVFALQKDSTKGPYHSPDDSTQGIASLSFRPDRKLLAIGYWDGKTRIFSQKKASSKQLLVACLKTEKLVRTDRLPGVTSVRFRERGEYELFVCTRGDGCCRLWPIFPSVK